MPGSLSTMNEMVSGGVHKRRDDVYGNASVHIAGVEDVNYPNHG